MSSKDIKAHLHHELLNLVTVLQFRLHEEEFPKDTLGTYMHTLKLLQWLIRFDDIILNKKTGVCVRPYSLRDIVDNSIISMYDILETAACSVTSTVENVMYATDRDIFSEALSCVLFALIQKNRSMVFSFDRHSAVLQLSGDISAQHIRIDSPAAFLNRKDIVDGHFVMSLGNELLKRIGIAMHIEENTLTFRLKKQQLNSAYIPPRE